MSLGLERGTRACHNSRMQLSIVCSRVAMSSPRVSVRPTQVGSVELLLCSQQILAPTRTGLLSSLDEKSNRPNVFRITLCFLSNWHPSLFLKLHSVNLAFSDSNWAKTIDVKPHLSF